MASVSPPAQHGEVSALAALITNATKTVEAYYAKQSPDKPYIPSLDSMEPHPLDTALNSDSGAVLRTAIQTIQGACAQLAATVARPSQTMVNKFMDFYEPNCLNIAMNFKIPDVLREKPEGMHISEIAQKTGLEERKVGRVLRLLATKHAFREVSENIFANNRLSIQLLSDNPLTSLGLHLTEECQRANALLPEILGDKEWGHSNAPNHTAFNKLTGFEEHMFFYGKTPEGAKIRERFGIAMIGWADACQAHNVIYEFPWKDLGAGATVCDVGGGVGDITLALAKEYPNLKLTLQDLPETIRQAQEEVWPQRCPQAIKENRIKFVPLNFLKESPVPGQDVYYLKNVIHDWPDASCITILSNISKVMTPRSRMLIHEYIIQPASRVPSSESARAASSLTQAPPPLLPNYGAGRIQQYNVDIDMMTMLNSEERRLADFVRLGEAAGLGFVKVWDVGETGVVEFRLA